MGKESIKADCFAFKQGVNHVDCECLKELYCKKENCRFYMSADDYVKKNGETYQQTLFKLDRKLL